MLQRWLHRWFYRSRWIDELLKGLHSYLVYLNFPSFNQRVIPWKSQNHKKYTCYISCFFSVALRITCIAPYNQLKHAWKLMCIGSHFEIIYRD